MSWALSTVQYGSMVSNIAKIGVWVGCALALCGCHRDADRNVAAIVNGYEITYLELQRYYQNEVSDMVEPPTEEQAEMLRMTVLRELIDRYAMLQRAEKEGLMAVDSDVQTHLADYQALHPDVETFRKYLGKRGMTIEEFKEELRCTLTIERLLNREISSAITVTEDEIRIYYDENRASFNLPEQQYHISEIVVTPNGEESVPNLRNDDATDQKSALEKIGMIEQRLRRGEDFDVLARSFSEDPVSTANGGDLGFIPQSSLEKVDIALRRAVASLSPGEMSPIIRTERGYLILKLVSKQGAGQRELSDPGLQQTIREMLVNSKEQVLRAAFLEILRNGAEVENYLAREIAGSYGFVE